MLGFFKTVVGGDGLLDCEDFNDFFMVIDTAGKPKTGSRLQSFWDQVRSALPYYVFCES